MDELNMLPSLANQPELPSTFQPERILQMATNLPVLFNTLNVRRAIIPAANGHCSARALARYYATLADGGLVPPPHSSLSQPPLGSHTHVPKFSASNDTAKKRKGKEMAATEKRKPKDHQEKKRLYDEEQRMSAGRGRDSSTESLARLVNDTGTSAGKSETSGNDQGDVHNMFSNPRIHDAFMGAGEYSGLVLPDGKFGLGFKRVTLQDGSLVGFGHSGIGGSIGFCDIKNRFSIAITLNKMSLGSVTANIIRLVCSELNIPYPKDFAVSSAIDPDSEMGSLLVN